MKKFLIALTVIIVTSIGCKKELEGGGICACSFDAPPYLSLVIKNAAGNDLLNSKTNGYIPASQLKVYRVETNGSTKNIEFGVRPPFSYGSNQFAFHQLYSQQVAALKPAETAVYYLQLANLPPYKLTVQMSTTFRKVEKLWIDDKEAPGETGLLQNYSDGNIFYLEVK